MTQECEVGLFGSHEAIEQLWKYVYQLKLHVAKLEKLPREKNGHV
jgi:hypothetical protein